MVSKSDEMFLLLSGDKAVQWECVEVAWQLWGDDGESTYHVRASCPAIAVLRLRFSHDRSRRPSRLAGEVLGNRCADRVKEGFLRVVVGAEHEQLNGEPSRLVHGRWQAKGRGRAEQGE